MMIDETLVKENRWFGGRAIVESVHHGGVRRSRAVSATTSTCGVSCGVSQAPGGNAQHPGAFRTSKQHNDGGTAPFMRPLPAMTEEV